MRVTHNISNDMYLRNTNRMNSSMLKSMTRIMTQRRFNRVSEDVINGVKAMSIRRQLRNVEIYRDNLNVSKELFSSAEQSLITMADKIYIQMETELVAAANGTYDQMELDIYSQSFDQMAEEMVKTLNADFAERQIFGGTNNGVAPFRIEQAIVKDPDGKVVYPPDWETYYVNDGNGGIALDDDGQIKLQDGITMDDIPKSVLYNGVPLNFDVLTNDFDAGTYTVSSLGLNEEGKRAFTDDEFELTDEAINTARNKHDNSLIFPGSKPIYVDIGIGIKYDNEGKVDPQTALDISLNGASITGSGFDDEGFSKNLIQLALDTAYNLKRGINVAKEMDLDKANTALANIAAKTSGGQKLTSSELSALQKELAEGKIGGVLYEDKNGNYVVSVGGKEIYNSGSTENAPYLEYRESPDSGYVLFEDTANGGTVKVSKLIGDQGYVNAVIDKANEANGLILKSITTLGIRQNTIDFYLDRMTDTEFNLKDRQNLVEGTDMAEEITNEYNLQAAYEAALKMGSWVLPKSIFDFV